MKTLEKEAEEFFGILLVTTLRVFLSALMG
jgi:hypothetical protein